MDPIGFQSGSANFYEYTRNSPNDYSDPHGFCPTCSAQPTIPISPPGVSVDFNIAITKDAMWQLQFQNTGTELNWFYNMVNTGNPWDYKQQGEQYVDFGNFNFGATCGAMGYSLYFCQSAAGLARDWRALRLRLPLGSGIPFVIPPYGDQANDQRQIMAGYQYQQWAALCNH